MEKLSSLELIDINSINILESVNSIEFTYNLYSDLYNLIFIEFIVPKRLIQNWINKNLIKMERLKSFTYLSLFPEELNYSFLYGVIPSSLETLHLEYFDNDCLIPPNHNIKLLILETDGRCRNEYNRNRIDLFFELIKIPHTIKTVCLPRISIQKINEINEKGFCMFELVKDVPTLE